MAVEMDPRMAAELTKRVQGKYVLHSRTSPSDRFSQIPYIQARAASARDHHRRFREGRTPLL